MLKFYWQMLKNMRGYIEFTVTTKDYGSLPFSHFDITSSIDTTHTIRAYGLPHKLIKAYKAWRPVFAVSNVYYVGWCCRQRATLGRVATKTTNVVTIDEFLNPKQSVTPTYDGKGVIV